MESKWKATFRNVLQDDRFRSACTVVLAAVIAAARSAFSYPDPMTQRKNHDRGGPDDDGSKM